MPRLQNMLMLSNEGYSNLKKGIRACTLTNLSMMLPFSIVIMSIIEIIKPFSGLEMSWNRLWLLFGFGIVCAIIIFLFNRNDYEKTYLTSYTASESARVAIAEHIRKLPMSLFNSKDLTELTNNFMGDVEAREHTLSHLIPQIIANILSVTFICLMLAILDWRMALAVFISVPVAFGMIFVSRRIYGKLLSKHQDTKLVASSKVQEYIEGIKIIRAHNLDGEKFSVLENALRSMKKMAVAMEFGTGVFVTAAQVVLQLGIGITVLLGTTLLAGGQIELMPLLAFFLIVTRIYGPFMTLLMLVPELLYFQISLNRTRRLMAIKPMEGAEIGLANTDICFEDVSFNYSTHGENAPKKGSLSKRREGKNALQKGRCSNCDEGKNALENISFSLKANTLTALVGPSGSGKSTVSRLIARFWDVNKGRITVGGVDVKTLDPEHLMSYMSFVFQDVILFNDTVLNNIRIGKSGATEEEIIAAAKAACCDDFIAKLPNGYNTMLGENGATLSGGERQRISIARALLKNAPIVLLDEATASLDPENELEIQSAISRLIENKTVVVIAHRLRTVLGADKIIVLDKGKLVEEGTSEELLAANGLFARLYGFQQEKQMQDFCSTHRL